MCPKGLITAILGLLFLVSCNDSQSDPPLLEKQNEGGLWGVWEGGDTVVILHQGHASFDCPCASLSLVPIAEKLCSLGYTVYGFEMPHTIAADGTWDPHGPPIEQYYEPVLDLIDSLPKDTSIFMIGLSGGGWTTTVCTALSDRIIRGYSVAGDIPLDLREPDEMGDWEQVNLPWSYCELYAMAEGRLLHIFNQFDPCCFAYSGTEEELGTPFAIDSTHQEHKISEWALNYIIDDMELAIVTCNLLQGNPLWDIP